MAAGRVVVRGDDDQDVLLQIASASSVPVLVGGSTIGDPVQVLADVLTAEDQFGFSSVSVVFFGDARVGLGRSYVDPKLLVLTSPNDSSLELRDVVVVHGEARDESREGAALGVPDPLRSASRIRRS